MKIWFCVLAFATVFSTSTALAQEPAEVEANDPDNDVFGLLKFHRFEINVGAKEYEAMDPPPVNPFGGPTGRGPRRGPAPGSPDFGAGNFGFEFDYVRADVRANGEEINNVGLRYKGSGTYMMSQRQAKRSFKIDFDRYDSDQRFRELKKLNLNSGVMDPTKVREALAYRVFATVGVPASRTAFAEVWLNVPGKYDNEYLGIYTVVEQVNKQFLKRHFGNSSGLLLKPEGIRGVPHFGDDMEAYKHSYNARENEDDPAGWDRLVEFTRLVNLGSDQEFEEQIDSMLNLENFAQFLAVNTMLSSMDGFIGMGHNYYLYLSPTDNRFAFFPWDLDLAFGSFPMFGSPEQLADLSIEHPHVGDNKLIARLLAMPSFNRAYREQLRLLAEKVFVEKPLLTELAALQVHVDPLLAKDKDAAEARGDTGGSFGFGPPGGGGLFGVSMPLKDFITRRRDSVLAQLDGQRKGYTPASGFGFGPPGGFGPAAQLSRPLLEKLDSDKSGRASLEEFTGGLESLAREWDTDDNNELDQQELSAGLQKLLPPAPFGPPGPGGLGPGGFGPGRPFAPPGGGREIGLPTRPAPFGPLRANKR